MSTSCRKPSSNTIPPNAFYGQTPNEHTLNEHTLNEHTLNEHTLKEHAPNEHQGLLPIVIQETDTKAHSLKRKAPHDTPNESHRNVKCRTDSITRDDHELSTDLQPQGAADKRSTTRGRHRSLVRHHTPLGTDPRPQPPHTKISRRACKRKATARESAQESPLAKRGRYSSFIGHRTHEWTEPMSPRPRTPKFTQPPITKFMPRRVKGTVARPPNNARDHSDAWAGGDQRPNARAPESPTPPPPPATKEETLRMLSPPETTFFLAMLNVMEIYKLDADRTEHMLRSLLSKEVLRLGVVVEDVMSVVSRSSSYKQRMLKIGRE